MVESLNQTWSFLDGEHCQTPREGEEFCSWTVLGTHYCDMFQVDTVGK
jgi:hypothetical protein